MKTEGDNDNQPTITVTSSGRIILSRKLEKEKAQRHWKNKNQHLIYFLGYCVNLRSLCSFIYEDSAINPPAVPSLLQTLLIVIVVGGPLVFLLHFIGQFTQKSCIAIGTMLPAMYGLGYCMLVVAILDCIITLHFSGPGLLYILTSVTNYPIPPWMICSDKFYEMYPNCFSRNDIDLCKDCTHTSEELCFEPGTKIFAAKIFMYLIAFERENLEFSEIIEISPPQLKSVCHIFITIALVYFIACRKIKSLDWALRLSLTFCFLSATVSLVVVFSHEGILRGLRNVFVTDFYTFIRMDVWIAAFRRVTEAFKISSGGLVLLGSYMNMDTLSHFRVCYLIGFYILIYLFFHLHYHLIAGLLSCKLNMKDYGIQSGNDIIFTLYPTEFGLMATPQLWSFFHFTIFWILSIITMALQVIQVDEALSEEFKIQEYYLYTRCCICSIIFFFAVPMTGKKGNAVVDMLVHELKIINLLIVVLIFLTILMYNIQRLKDDIHFVLRVPPSWYVQASWVIGSIASLGSFIYEMCYYKSDKFYTVKLLLYSCIGFLMFIGFIVKLVLYIKRQNIIGIIRPSRYYGPPDLETRMLRLLYNPRLEVRYRRRMEVCRHHCLQNSEVAAKVMEREVIILSQIIDDIKRNPDFEQGSLLHTLNVLQRQLVLMKIRLSDVKKNIGNKPF